MVAQVLQRPTLVLNRSWQPVNVATVARALVLVWSDSARVVDPDDYQLYDWDDWAQLEPKDDEPFIQCVSQQICVPEVITLTQFNRLPTTTVAFSRRNLFKRDKFTCQYCGIRPKHDELTIDHVVPRSHGGGSTWENCVLACIRCNHRKADRTPKQAGLKIGKVPIRPNWSPAYSRYEARYESWTKFISDAYWNAELKE
jgi:5-methylcytosine-specific restriction endonuclease McrA